MVLSRQAYPVVSVLLFTVFTLCPDRTKLSRREGGLGKVAIPLLSDLTHQISKDYGVLLENEGHTLRGLFIIDGSGILRQITMNDLPVGRSVDETIRLIQAFRYTDDHGEVCPAGWKPGADTVSVLQTRVYAEQPPVLLDWYIRVPQPRKKSHHSCNLFVRYFELKCESK